AAVMLIYHTQLHRAANPECGRKLTSRLNLPGSRCGRERRGGLWSRGSDIISIFRRITGLLRGLSNVRATVILFVHSGLEDGMGRLPRFVAVALVASLKCSGPALSQDWPTRPVTMVVPFAAGGPADTVGRILAPGLSEFLGQQVIIENVGGSGGMTGTS